MLYTQNYSPLPFPALSLLVAALPVLALFYLLVIRRAPASLAAIAGAISAFLIAVLIYKMPVEKAGMSFVNGALFGLFPISWTVACAMFLYNMTVATGRFELIKNSVASLSADHRLQAVLIAFCFGAFLEGAAGGGAPVAICAAMLVGLGFRPFTAAVICLIANTSPVAYGGFGTPILTPSKRDQSRRSEAQSDGWKSTSASLLHYPFLDGSLPLLVERDLSGASCDCGRWRFLRSFTVLFRALARLPIDRYRRGIDLADRHGDFPQILVSEENLANEV